MLTQDPAGHYTPATSLRISSSSRGRHQPSPPHREAVPDGDDSLLPLVRQSQPDRMALGQPFVPTRVSGMPLDRSGPHTLANARLLRPRRRRDERMGMAAPIYYTADMVRAMPDDGNRYEVVYGELLVTPSPRPWHQVVVQRLSLALGNYLEREPAGLVLSSPADISWGPDVLVQPDVFVVPIGRGADAHLEPDAHAAAGRRGAEPVVHQRRPLPQAAALPGGGRAALLGGGWRRAGRRGVDAGGRFPGRSSGTGWSWRPAAAAEPFSLRLEELFRPV